MIYPRKEKGIINHFQF